jgi:hypothetical protein
LPEHDLLLSQRQQTRGLRVPRLVHAPSGSFYRFDLRASRHYCQYSPGEETLVEEQYPGDWAHQHEYIWQWLRRLKREAEEPDLWAAISGESALVLGASAGGVGNAPFSSPERQRISGTLNEIREYLVATQQLSGARLAFAEERLRYLEEASSRIGRKDWVNLAYGALINIAVGAALSPQAARDAAAVGGRRARLGPGRHADPADARRMIRWSPAAR